jgi:hypothetical protein
MSDNALKKEFRPSDVERIRNLVNKDYTSKTKYQSGYNRQSTRHEEGDIWEENGKQWTIKNGLKQNITKLDKAKKAVHVPLACPKCSGSMSHHLSKKIYKVNKMCFNCFIDYEAELKRNGQYENYLIHARKGNIEFFIAQLEQELQDMLNAEDSFVTEQGDVETWKVNKSKTKEMYTEKFQEFITYLRSKVE